MRMFRALSSSCRSLGFLVLWSSQILVLSDSGPLAFSPSHILVLWSSSRPLAISFSCRSLGFSDSRSLILSNSHPLRFSSSRISVLSHCRPYVDVEAIVSGKTILAAIAFVDIRAIVLGSLELANFTKLGLSDVK